jgi:phosphate transport system substrate-binding protein
MLVVERYRNAAPHMRRVVRLENVFQAVIAPIHDDFKVSLVNAPGAGAYPIASFPWLAVPVHIADDRKHDTLVSFLKWMLGPGQRQAAALGYLALPKELAAREEAAVASIH